MENDERNQARELKPIANKESVNNNSQSYGVKLLSNSKMVRLKIGQYVTEKVRQMNYFSATNVRKNVALPGRLLASISTISEG